MTMPHDHKPHGAAADHQPEAMVSSHVWNQDAPVGGEDIHGTPAQYAEAVSVQGIVTVRDVPTLAAAAGKLTLAANVGKRFFGMAPQRRRITVTFSAAGFLCLTQNDADNNNGLIMPANVPFVSHYAGEMYAVITAGGDVSWWAELDQG